MSTLTDKIYCDKSRMNEIIENCSNCWHRTPDGIDVMVCHILFRLFLQYQEDGKMPDYINYNV